MTDKMLDQVLGELLERQLFIGEPGPTKHHRYHRATFDQVAVLPGFILVEVDRSDDDGSPFAITWWPAGMVSEEIQRGVPMEVPLMFTEARMLSAVNKLEHILVTMAPGIDWDASWPELVSD